MNKLFFLLLTLALPAIAENLSDETLLPESNLYSDPTATWGVYSPASKITHFDAFVSASLEDLEISVQEEQLSVKFYPALKAKFSGTLSLDTIKVLASKLDEVDKVYPRLSTELMLTIQIRLWRLSNEPSTSLLGNYVKLAQRALHSVFLYTRYWNQLSPAQQAAIVFYNAFTSLIPTSTIYDGKESNQAIAFRLNYQLAKEITVYLFSDDLQKYGGKGLHKLASYFSRYKTDSYLISQPNHWIKGFSTPFYHAGKGEAKILYHVRTVDLHEFFGNHISGASYCDEIKGLKTSITVTVPITLRSYIESDALFMENSSHHLDLSTYRTPLPEGSVRSLIQILLPTELKSFNSLYPEQNFTLSAKDLATENCVAAMNLKLRDLKKAIFADLVNPWMYELLF